MNARLAVAALGCLGASLVLHAGQAPSQSQLPTFRAEARFVEVDAVVRDEDGNFVPGLTRDDFEILEDDKPQKVETLSVLNLPVDRKGRPAEAVAGGLDAPISIESTADIGRIYVMILDSGQGAPVKNIARQFILEFMGPADLMAVIHTWDPTAMQGITNDKDLLLASVDDYAGPSRSSIESIRAIKNVAVNLNSVTGRRKAIVFIGAGTGAFWSSALDETELQRRLWREYDDAVKTAARNNVRIYPVDPGGFLSPNEGVDFASARPPGGNSANTGLAASAPAGFNLRTPGGFGPGDANSTRLQRRPGTPSAAAQSSLRMMAEDTGSIAIVNTNNFAGNFKHVVRDNSEYYMLGYYSPAERDGLFHRITVRLKNRPDLSIRSSRAGYAAQTADAKGRSVKMPKGLTATARNALSATGPVAGLPIEIFTAVFQANGFDGSVLVASHVPGAMLKLGRNERIELSYVAVDRWNQVRAAERRAFTLGLGETTRARVEQTGLRLFGRLRLPRGRYQIRVVVHQPGGGTGSAVTDVEVPDFTDLPLSVSDLVVASSKGSTLLTLEEDAVLRRALPAQPTPSRRFSRGEILTIFGEIYDSHSILSQEIGITSIITAEDGRVLAQDKDTLSSANRLLESAWALDGRFFYTGKMPLAPLADGTYMLTVEAYTRTGVPASASQQFRFEVRGD